MWLCNMLKILNLFLDSYVVGVWIYVYDGVYMSDCFPLM